MFVPQVSQTIVDHHSLSRAVPRWRSPPLRTLSAGRLKMVPVPTTRPCLLKCLHKIHTKRGGTVCWHADTHYSIYCSSTQRLRDPPPSSTPPALTPHHRRPPLPAKIWPNCLGCLPAALSGRRTAFAAIGQQGEFLLAVGRHLSWGGRHHLGLALSPSQDVSQWTHFFSNPFLSRSWGHPAVPQTWHGQLWNHVDCSELSSSAGDPSQLSPEWKHKMKGGVRHWYYVQYIFLSSSAIPRL